MSCLLSVRSPSDGREQTCVELCDVDKLILDLCHQATLNTPTSCDLAARPCVALPYSGSAIHSPSRRLTHCLCDTHSVHIFTDPDTYTTHRETLTEACPPYTLSYQSQRVLYAFTDELGSY